MIMTHEGGHAQPTSYRRSAGINLLVDDDDDDDQVPTPKPKKSGPPPGVTPSKAKKKQKKKVDVWTLKLSKRCEPHPNIYTKKWKGTLIGGMPQWARAVVAAATETKIPVVPPTSICIHTSSTCRRVGADYQSTRSVPLIKTLAAAASDPTPFGGRFAGVVGSRQGKTGGSNHIYDAFGSQPTSTTKRTDTTFTTPTPPTSMTSTTSTTVRTTSTSTTSRRTGSQNRFHRLTPNHRPAAPTRRGSTWSPTGTTPTTPPTDSVRPNRA
jgi:hypothetical protein